MKNPWSFFKEIYVINLEHREDRRQHIRNHFSRFPGLEYSFFQGVYGMKSRYLSTYVDKKNIVQFIPDENGIFMSRAQLACIMSHYMIWQQALLRVPEDSPGYWILIFEDDIEFHPDFSNDILQEYLDSLPSDALMIKMVYQNAEKYSDVKQVNTHWNKLEKQVFSMMAYAVHTDLLLYLLTNIYKNPLDWYPIHCAYGFIDICKDGNKTDEFFNYDYIFENNKQLYKFIGTYNGVGRSFQKDRDSDINYYTRHSS
jgi:GR25 family glycosyltransferase involved in LPS biosynthesis